MKNSFVKYVIFAILTSAVNVAIYLFVYNLIIKNIIVANFFAYAISITLSFFINKQVVFKNKMKRVYKQMFFFLMVKAIAFVIDSAVLAICLNIFDIPNAISKLIANCSTTLSNYSLNKKMVFKEE